MQLALGDALAIALLERRGFTAEHFRVFHPGGKLGARLRSCATSCTPTSGCRSSASTRDGRGHRRDRRQGLRLGDRRESDGRLAGIVTDGDLRRNLRPDLGTLAVSAIMRRKPRTIAPDALFANALEIQETAKIAALIVVADERPVGLVHYLDLLRVGAA